MFTEEQVKRECMTAREAISLVRAGRRASLRPKTLENCLSRLVNLVLPGPVYDEEFLSFLRFHSAKQLGDKYLVHAAGPGKVLAFQTAHEVVIWWAEEYAYFYKHSWSVNDGELQDAADRRLTTIKSAAYLTELLEYEKQSMLADLNGRSMGYRTKPGHEWLTERPENFPDGEVFEWDDDWTQWPEVSVEIATQKAVPDDSSGTETGHSEKTPVPDDVNEIRRLMKLKAWKHKKRIDVCRHYVSKNMPGCTPEETEKSAQSLDRKFKRYDR